MSDKFQIGQLVTIRGTRIKPGRVIDFVGFTWAIVAWKVKSKNLNLITTKRVKLSRLILYTEPPKKSLIRKLFSYIIAKFE